MDTGPDLRQQALTHGIRHIDAVLYTHGHADHILGIDELRRYNAIQHRAMKCYGDPVTLGEIRQVFGYVFNAATPKGGGVPDLELVSVDGEFEIEGQRIVPVPLMHGKRPILGFRFDGFAYLTDCSRIPDGSWSLLQGLDVLVLDALRERPHPTHFSVDEALAAVRRIGPRRAYFTHMCHDLPHAATCARLPEGVELAYDGLIVRSPNSEIRSRRSEVRSS